MERESLTDVEVVVVAFRWGGQEFSVDLRRDIEVTIDFSRTELHFEFAARGEYRAEARVEDASGIRCIVLPIRFSVVGAS